MATFIQQGILHFCLVKSENGHFHPTGHFALLPHISGQSLSSKQAFWVRTQDGQQTPYVLQVHMATFNQQCISTSWEHQNFKMPQLNLVNFPSLGSKCIWPLPSTDLTTSSTVVVFLSSRAACLSCLWVHFLECKLSIHLEVFGDVCILDAHD